jgi:RNA polymerase sigma factor (sigma-70 family)
MDDRRDRFQAQVLVHLDAAYRFARCLTRSPADADDIVQEAFLRAFRAFDTLRGGDVKSWLFVIVRNCHASAASRAQRRELVPLPEEHEAITHPALIAGEPGPESRSIESDERRVLEQVLASLPLEQREILVLREIEDMSYREIAEVTALPIGTVMSRLARARGALRERWLELAGDTHAVS